MSIRIWHSVDGLTPKIEPSNQFSRKEEGE